MKKRKILPPIYYKITESSDGLFNVYIREEIKSLFGFKKDYKWNLLQSGFEQIAFCAEKYILRRHYKSNNWEWGHRFTGGNDEAGTVLKVRCHYDKETEENNYEPDMIVPFLYIDCTEISEESLHNYDKGCFDDYLNDKQHWIDARKIYREKFKFKCESRLLALDAKFINCPRGHPNEEEIYADSNKYQADHTRTDWDIIKNQDISFVDYSQWVSKMSYNLFDCYEHEDVMYDIFDLTVKYFQQGKSANTALKAARKIIKEKIKNI